MSADCPCGRPSAGCEYHDPALQPPPPTEPAPELSWDDLDRARTSVVVWGAAHIRKGDRLGYTTPTGDIYGTVAEIRPNGTVVLTLDGEVRGVSLSGTLKL